MEGQIQMESAKAAYEAIAAFYDDFTADHDFDLWLGNLMPAIERYEPSGRRLLDVACGTGKSFLPLMEGGWSVTARDIAPAMVAIAKKKAVEQGGSSDIGVGDMRCLPVLGEFDLVWCLTDALNYLLAQEELEASLAGMGRNLAPTGVLAFDVNTLHAFRTFFAKEVAVKIDGRRMMWKGKGSTAAASGSISEATFEVETGSDGDPKAAIHRQRHFPQADVMIALERSGLTCLDVFGIQYDAVLQQPLDEDRHTKAVYIAQRRGAA